MNIYNKAIPINRTKVELKQYKNIRRQYLSIYQSYQSGIETYILPACKIGHNAINRTKVELKPLKPR